MNPGRVVPRAGWRRRRTERQRPATPGFGREIDGVRGTGPAARPPCGRGVPLALLVMLCGMRAFAAADPALVNAANRIDPSAPAWRQLAAGFATQQAVIADFEERRHFAFRREPVVLKGIARILGDAGLSLEYTAPEERIVIVDREGLLVRDRAGNRPAPGDPRAGAANEALLHILRFDLAALAKTYDLYGRREEAGWILALVPRDEAIRRAIGDIFVEGEAAAVRRIELRRSARQNVEIRIDEARDVTFTPEERRLFFR
jgi:hypothetical protein